MLFDVYYSTFLAYFIWINQILHVLQKILSSFRHGLIVPTPDLHHHLRCRWLSNQLSRLLTRLLSHIGFEMHKIRAQIRLLGLHQGLSSLFYKFSSMTMHILAVRLWPLGQHAWPCQDFQRWKLHKGFEFNVNLGCYLEISQELLDL